MLYSVYEEKESTGVSYRLSFHEELYCCSQYESYSMNKLTSTIQVRPEKYAGGILLFCFLIFILENIIISKHAQIVLIYFYLDIQECNNFLAGNMLCSAKRYHALDETAVFVYCCCPKFPGKIVNLKLGER